MAWQDDLVAVLRPMINDDSTPYTYSSSRLEQLIVLAGMQVKFDIGGFDTEYTFDMITPDISPDPTTPTQDETFIVLVTMKAACIVDKNEVRDATDKGIRVKQGRSEFDLRERAKNKSGQLEGEHSWCAMYAAALDNYRVNAGNAGRAILGPFAGDATGGLRRYLDGFYER